MYESVANSHPCSMFGTKSSRTQINNRWRYNEESIHFVMRQMMRVMFLENE